ncbi:N(G),N(G)-dimethylarginine dimethylaminohydrolase 1 isoform X1 [Schistocerca americana]|uniref:N(G),N(G)-dimethylarginine dimethylaminohydrolase 1 isoform X1 n=1 Tax=Schistocerca americana TaxID=7009 RepID=UPI001F4F7E5D|nr:N(G),N(G)-dimethylarginine dimethylaminohydrolase 1 isoform X1 [Schistocerca americana]XP_047098865.1 N(G),N(G)-dimethylarginine dimethylaminohydrolase 1 isoform X1 [Schistocerca piceifrons]XP_049963619.1 N(G),N(G)-dimethylarginine dimethylaminohydrolase 1 isoform X1 [Schistocerca serialis cubense]
MASSLKFTHAVVCRIPLSFRTRAEIELEEAKRQHEAYVRLLRELGLDVIELPPDEAQPECVYVEDTAVVCNGIALITRPGSASRTKEVETVRAVLKKELDLPIVEIADESAKLDGGDVLFTGREFFVGLSEWTNEAGARAVAAAFPEFPCTPVKVRPCVDIDDTFNLDMIQVAESRHLKALVSMAGPDVMCVGAGKAAQEVLKRIEREATFSYQTLTVPEDIAANVLYVNGTLIHRSVEEIPESCKVFAERIDFPRRSLSMSELAKAGSGLSSCCLLFRRMKHIRNL